MEHQPQPAAAGGAHLHHLGFALGELLHHDAGIGLVDVDHHLLDRLQDVAGLGVALEQHLGARDRELEALAPHGLDQNAELQLAAARHLDRVVVGRFGDLERHIALGLAEQAVANHAAGDLAAFGAGERGIVDPERHGERRRIHRLGGQRIGRPRGRRWCARRSPRAGPRPPRCRPRTPPRPVARSRPRNASTLVTRPFSISLPSRSSTLTLWLGSGKERAGERDGSHGGCFGVRPMIPVAAEERREESRRCRHECPRHFG